MKIVGTSEKPLGLVDVATLAGLDKSTTSRLLRVLEQQGFVRRESSSRLYSSGPTLISLASFAMGQMDLVKLARSDLVALRDETGETVSLHVRQQLNRVCVDGAESLHMLRRAVPWGGHLPLYQGPSGKAILAFMSEAHVEASLEQAREAGFDTAAIRKDLSAVRERGLAIGVGDRTPDVGAVSVPIFDREGVTGSITIAGPAERWSIGRMEETEARLRDVASVLSARLGSSFGDNGKWEI